MGIVGAHVFVVLCVALQQVDVHVATATHEELHLPPREQRQRCRRDDGRQPITHGCGCFPALEQPRLQHRQAVRWHIALVHCPSGAARAQLLLGAIAQHHCPGEGLQARREFSSRALRRRHQVSVGVWSGAGSVPLSNELSQEGDGGRVHTLQVAHVQRRGHQGLPHHRRQR